MFTMKCPVHPTIEIEEDRAFRKKSSNNADVEKVKVFFCPECDCYYVHTENKQEDKKLLGKLKGKNVFYSTNPLGYLMY